MGSMDDKLASMMRGGGKRKKAKGLPKRHSNPAKKLRHKRSWERSQARKRRNVLRQQGPEGLKRWDVRRLGG